MVPNNIENIDNYEIGYTAHYQLRVDPINPPLCNRPKTKHV